ncbi:putative tick transposon [Operophtera brumata]|uniref:Putative tick transposon n=1 Tax=Operophtera brumata TaxID=104452 RepID=A0A0L7KUM7_OPEBR|nr:putative tick transposon [Operophtera brumata]
MTTDKKMPTIYSNDPLAAIMELDAKLESCAASFEGRLSSASSTSNPSLEQLAADFKQFKDYMKLAIDLIRTQVSHVTSAVDEMENRSRRKFILFRGVRETEGENLRTILSGVIVGKLKIKEFNPDSIRLCYRLGKDKREKSNIGVVERRRKDYHIIRVIG